MPPTPLEVKFRDAMLSIYEQAKETGYRPTRFKDLVIEVGGVEAARQLLRGKMSSGLDSLAAVNRLDLCMECLVLRAEYRELFTSAELATARRRVEDLKIRCPN